MNTITLLIIMNILIKIGIFILGIYIVLNVLRLLAMRKRYEGHQKDIRDEVTKNNKGEKGR